MASWTREAGAVARSRLSHAADVVAVMSGVLTAAAVIVGAI